MQGGADASLVFWAVLTTTGVVTALLVALILVSRDELLEQTA